MNRDFYNQDTVSEIIEKYCADHQINESDFAVLIGVHATHLSRIKRGLMCSPEILQKIAALGGRRPQDLVRDIPDEIRQKLILSGAKNGLPVAV
jgi:hypothetical protein